MADFEAVEFSTFDGVTLRGDFFRTDGHNRPAVVLVPGLGMLKEHVGGSIAAALRDMRLLGLRLRPPGVRFERRRATPAD